MSMFGGDTGTQSKKKGGKKGKKDKDANAVK